MAFAPGQALIQNLSMRQEMVMTPQMIQNMEILQLPIMELEQRLSQELLQNPALEMLEMEEVPEDSSEGLTDAAGQTDAPAGEPEAVERDLEEIEFDEMEVLSENSLAAVDYIDEDWTNVFDDDVPSGRGAAGDDEDDPHLSVLHNIPTRPQTLHEYLLEQLSYRDLSPGLRSLCGRMVGLMDEAGYIGVPGVEADAEEAEVDDDTLESLVPMAKALQMDGESEPPSLSDVADALDTIQRLEPHGVGARNVKECLLIQIDTMLGAYTLEYQMVNKHFRDLAANRLPVIVKSMQCTMDEVKAVHSFLGTLDPHPGYAFGRPDPRHIVPDVRIEYDEDTRDFIITLNKGTLPPVRVSEDYRSALASEKRGTPEREFLRERIASAEWIIQAIEQRNRTLLAVTREIVARQRDYFSGNTTSPAPLMMQHVADSVRVVMRVNRNNEWVEEEKIGVDISTVSRAVREKYAESPRGLICLRDMFTHAVGGDDDRLPGARDASNVQVMDLMRNMIDKEDPANPLKDGQIMRLLKAEGISIARRTVAKYRDLLNVPSHTRRKRY